MRLFVARDQAADPGFAFDDSSVAAVGGSVPPKRRRCAPTEACLRFPWLPLAIVIVIVCLLALAAVALAGALG